MPLKDPEKRKAYHQKYMREVWYPKNKAKHTQYQYDNRKRLVEELRKLKVEIGCKDCGYNLHGVALDFDHVVTGKRFNIASAARKGYSMKTIHEEIKKCEVVCANCHRIRTLNRRSAAAKMMSRTRL